MINNHDNVFLPKQIFSNIYLIICCISGLTPNQVSNPPPSTPFPTSLPPPAVTNIQPPMYPPQAGVYIFLIMPRKKNKKKKEFLNTRSVDLYY